LESPRSGTWYTIRYALRRGKRVIIVWPDGRTERVGG
jgi:predicted Rossmann fold nucleotide-binding protein DprA/Smf involved in DNA uptake